jgi:membrane-associated phospholipid phosphatase
MATGMGYNPDTMRLAPVDRLLFGTLAVLALVAGAFHPHPARILLVYAALALFLWATARLAPRADVLHAFAPLVVVVGIFETLGFVVAVTNRARWDGYFAALDARLFGPLVPAWRQLLGRPDWLTDLLSLCYVSYYFVPTVMGAALYAARRRAEFDRLVLGLQAALVASYAGYFLFPTSGPRVPAEEAQRVLGGGAVSEAVRAFLRNAELNALDAFPSGHTAASLVFLAYGWSMFPRWRAALLAVVVGIVVSTVYMSQHYVIDLVAGALVAVAVLASVPGLQRALGCETDAAAPARGPWCDDAGGSGRRP